LCLLWKITTKKMWRKIRWKNCWKQVIKFPTKIIKKVWEKFLKEFLTSSNLALLRWYQHANPSTSSIFKFLIQILILFPQSKQEKKKFPWLFFSITFGFLQFLFLLNFLKIKRSLNIDKQPCCIYKFIWLKLNKLMMNIVFSV